MPEQSVLVGAVVDAEDQSTVFSIEAERRLGERWKIEVESRWFINVGRGNLLESVQDDDYLTLRVRRYF